MSIEDAYHRRGEALFPVGVIHAENPIPQRLWSLICLLHRSNIQRCEGGESMVYITKILSMIYVISNKVVTLSSSLFPSHLTMLPQQP
jgi:hypothetical protein